VFEAPIAQDYFQRVAPHVKPGTARVLGLMVAPHAMDGFLTFLARRPGPVIWRSDQPDWAARAGAGVRIRLEPHHAARAEGGPRRSPICRSATAPPTIWKRSKPIRAAFPGEVMQHLEVMKEGGKTMFAGPVAGAFTTEARLDEIVRCTRTWAA
jgi:hypothetical protein